MFSRCWSPKIVETGGGREEGGKVGDGGRGEGKVAARGSSSQNWN